MIDFFPFSLLFLRCLQHNIDNIQHFIALLASYYQQSFASFITTTLASINTRIIMSHSRQISEASNPEEFVAIALQNRDTSAAIQSMVADAQMHPGDIVYDDPLMPTGLFPLAQIELFNNSDVTTGRLPTTPGERRGPNTGPPHDVPASETFLSFPLDILN